MTRAKVRADLSKHAATSMTIRSPAQPLRVVARALRARARARARARTAIAVLRPAAPPTLPALT
eukprot:14647709-Heterocapsa_arctica.AAC.1